MPRGDAAGDAARAAPALSPNIAWREFFGDPRLRELIERALEHNRDLRIAALRIDQAAAQRRIVRADRFPTIGVDASASRSDYGEASGGQFGGGQGGAGSEQYRAGVGVSAFELDFWGRVRSLDAAARAEYLATIEAERAFRLGLIADVADAYLTQRELAQRLALAQDTIASRERSLYLARRLFEEGEGSQFEVQQELALLTGAHSERADLRNQAAQADNLLRLLVGVEPDAALAPPLALEQQVLVADIAAGLPSELLLRRPDVREAEQRLRAAEADIGAARAAFFPRITLTGALGSASPALGDLFTAGTGFWSAAADLLLPIFDAGRRRGELQVTQAQRDIAVAEYERTLQTTFREVADALAAREFLGEQLQAQRANRAAQAERLRLAQLRFDAGVASSIEVLDARRELFTAEQSVVTTRRAQLSNAVTLYVALGGGLR